MPRRRTVPPGRRLSRRWVSAVAVLAVVAAVVAVVLVNRGAATRDDTVATVGGTPVTADELRFHMERVLPAVRNAAGAAPTAEAVRQAALTEIAADDAILGLGREYGLVGFDDFAGFLREVDRVNTERATAVARGEVVYGLTRFGAQEYFGKQLTELRTRLIERLSAGDTPVLAVSDADVAAHLAAHPDEWSAGVADFATTRLTVPAAGLTVDSLAGKIRAAVDLETFAAGTAGAELGEVTVSASSAADPGAGVDPRTLAQLQSLPVGGITDPQTLDGGFVVYRIDRISVDPAAALQQYGSRIRAVLLESEFEELIAARITAQSTGIRHPGWDAVTLEDLRR